MMIFQSLGRRRNFSHYALYFALLFSSHHQLAWRDALCTRSFSLLHCSASYARCCLVSFVVIRLTHNQRDTFVTLLFWPVRSFCIFFLSSVNKRFHLLGVSAQPVGAISFDWSKFMFFCFMKQYQQYLPQIKPPGIDFLFLIKCYYRCYYYYLFIIYFLLF